MANRSNASAVFVDRDRPLCRASVIQAISIARDRENGVLRSPRSSSSVIFGDYTFCNPLAGFKYSDKVGCTSLPALGDLGVGEDRDTVTTDPSMDFNGSFIDTLFDTSVIRIFHSC